MARIAASHVEISSINIWPQFIPEIVMPTFYCMLSDKRHMKVIYQSKGYCWKEHKREGIQDSNQNQSSLRPG